MNEIALKYIQPSPNPVRKTWDEEKMEELAQSIREQGVIVPIKIRPLHSDTGKVLVFKDMMGANTAEAQGVTWEIVYGHRRVEAAKRAGRETIPAIVDLPDDNDALIQALIENVQREDMTPYDIALSLQAIKEVTDKTRGEIAAMFGWKSPKTVDQYLRQLRPEFVHITKGKRVSLSTIDRSLRAGSNKDAALIIEKSIRDGMTERETENAASAYKAADTPELKAAVLETSGKLPDAEHILNAARMKVGVSTYKEERQSQQRKAFNDYEQAVKDFIDAARLFDRMVKTARKAVKYGKFSPEGARFTARRIDGLINELIQLKESLENE